MFSRRWIINYVLIVLIVILTYVGNWFNVETGYQPQQPITGLKPADIESIEIQTADSTLRLKLTGGSWNLESPINWPANNIIVERLLDIVYIETDSRLSADEIDLATIGLQFPRAILRLNDTQVLFGATNNIGQRRYTMVGATVFLLPDVHLPFLTQGLVGIIDRRLLPRSFELNRLKLPDLEISRDQENLWRLSNTSSFSQPQVQRLVDNWQGLDASSVKPFKATAMPRQKIVVQLENGQSFEFFVMSIDPEIVIANPQIGMQYHFHADLYYQLISLRADATSG